MMINRLTGWSGEDPEVQLDYWVVRTSGGTFVVSPQEAERILQVLELRRPPRWLDFRDLSGSRVRVLAGDVMLVAECTRDQRAYDRKLRKELDREDDDREPWEA